MRFKLTAMAVALLSASVAAASAVFDVLPTTAYRAEIPTLASLAGYDWGEAISEPAQMAAFARALAAAAPERVRLVEYARSREGRPLMLLVVSSPENVARLDSIWLDLARVGDPRATSSDEAERLIAALPAVVWIACSVHGDEASGGDAGLALAYHLAAGRSAEIDAILRDAVVVVDPMQNPDGRARFVAATRQARGIEPDSQPASAEHVQPWPGGRFSHDLFDLNRDWFALTHPETNGRVAAMLRFLPQVVADLHEMGAEEGYYFAPPALPMNPLVSADQQALWDLVGRANAAEFDARGWRYWTRETFDSFYPGYGESWPFFSGAVGMTYEEASPRGLVQRTDENGTLRYLEAIQHHLTTAYTTCRVVARNREKVLRAWYGYRVAAVAAGRSGPGRYYLLEGGAAPQRAAALAELLARQGVEVSRVTASGEGLAAGDFVVDLAQPLGRLARVLLDRSFPMGQEFEREQERRWAKRLPDEIYDITAWSLPLLWQVGIRPLDRVPAGAAVAAVAPGFRPEGSAPAAARVAYLLPWDGLASAHAMAELVRAGVAVRVARKPLTLGGRRFERGTVVVRRGENGEDLPARVAAAARAAGVTFVAADSGFADSGVDLGSASVRRLRAPAVALAWDAPTSPSSAGDVRYALERVVGYPVTVVRTAMLGRIDLARFDVLLLPDARGAGSYRAVLGEESVRRLTAWVEHGGTLIGIGAGAAFLCEDKVGLLSSSLEKLEGSERKSADKGAVAASPPTYDERVRPHDEAPPSVPGAIVRVDLDAESLLAAGFPGGAIDVLAASGRLFAPLTLDRGTNVGIYATADRLLESGFMLDVSRRQLPRRAYLMLESRGRGRVVAFAEDPAFRGFAEASMLLLANAVFFSQVL